MLSVNIGNILLKNNIFLDIINVNNDIYKNKLPLSHKFHKGESIILRNNNNYEDLPIGLLRIYNNLNNIGEICDVYVNPKFRGKISNVGIKWSHLLFSIALKIAKKKLNVVWLWTLEDNIPAIKLYKFFEFKEFKNIKLSESIKSTYSWIGKRNILFFIKKI